MNTHGMNQTEVSELEALVREQFEADMAAIARVHALISKKKTTAVSPNRNGHKTSSALSLFPPLTPETINGALDDEVNFSDGSPIQPGLSEQLIPVIKRRQGQDFTATTLLEPAQKANPHAKFTYAKVARVLLYIHNRRKLPGLTITKRSLEGGNGKSRATVYRYNGID